MNRLTLLPGHSFPVEVLHEAGGSHTLYVRKARADDGTFVVVGPDGETYTQSLSSPLKHIRAPEYDPTPEPAEPSRPSDPADGLVSVQLIDSRGDADIIRVRSLGHDHETGRLAYEDENGTKYLARLTGKGVETVT